MSTPFEEMDPHPDVGPQFEGFSRYKRHTSRPTVRKPPKSHTDPTKIRISYFLLFIVYVVVILIIAFSFDKLVINTDVGFLFMVMSIISGLFITLWARLQPISKLKKTLTIMLLLLAAFVFWWLIIEFYKFKDFTFALSIITAVAISFLVIFGESLLLVVPLIAFLVGAWISKEV